MDIRQIVKNIVFVPDPTGCYSKRLTIEGCSMQWDDKGMTRQSIRSNRVSRRKTKHVKLVLRALMFKQSP